MFVHLAIHYPADDPWDQWCERPIDVFHLAQP